MREIWDGLPATTRWIVLGVAALVLLLALGGGVWSFLERREAAAVRALGSATLSYREALSSRQEAQLTAAATGLNQFLKDYPRSRHAAETWFLLGNVEYERRRFEAAAQAYESAIARDRGSVAALSRLGLGYAWEAKGDFGRALGTYSEALTGRGPKDFLYAEVLLGKARAEEQLSKRTEAVETYRKFLADVPESSQAETVRTRLAMLGAQQP